MPQAFSSKEKERLALETLNSAKYLYYIIIMPRKKEQIEHKSVSETQNQSETCATIKTTEIDTTFVKQIHNAMTFPCPVCTAILKRSSQIEISKKKGCKCNCVPFNFKVSTSTKSININKKDDGTIDLKRVDFSEIAFDK